MQWAGAANSKVPALIVNCGDSHLISKRGNGGKEGKRVKEEEG